MYDRMHWPCNSIQIMNVYERDGTDISWDEQKDEISSFTEWKGMYFGTDYLF